MPVKGEVRHSLAPSAYGSPLSKVYHPLSFSSRVKAGKGQQLSSSLLRQMFDIVSFDGESDNSGRQSELSSEFLLAGTLNP